jgi:hypothetical protein
MEQELHAGETALELADLGDSADRIQASGVTLSTF